MSYYVGGIPAKTNLVTLPTSLILIRPYRLCKISNLIRLESVEAYLFDWRDVLRVQIPVDIFNHVVHLHH